MSAGDLWLLTSMMAGESREEAGANVLGGKARRGRRGPSAEEMPSLRQRLALRLIAWGGRLVRTGLPAYQVPPVKAETRRRKVAEPGGAK